jgi:transposase
MEKPIIWLGMDVHARSIVIARLAPLDREPVMIELPNEPRAIARTFGALIAEGEVRCCYEAGPTGYDLHRQLTKMGAKCSIIAPSLIPQCAGDRVKTDRRDAIKLARLFRAGELTPIAIPSTEQEGVRDLLRAREDVRRDRTSARHRLGKFLLRRGLRFAGRSGWTQSHWEWIRKQRFDGRADQIVLEHYIQHVEVLDVQLAELEREIASYAQTETYREPVAKLSALRGVSTLAAMVLLTELLDLRRFSNPKQLMAYVGLVPSEHSTGDSKKRYSITKTGNGHVRRILVESAWCYRHPSRLGARQQRVLQGQSAEVTQIAQRANKRLGRRYSRLVARGKNPKLAVTAVARELCGFIWAIANTTTTSTTH